jgi:hypothetical protein
MDLRSTYADEKLQFRTTASRAASVNERYALPTCPVFSRSSTLQGQVPMGLRPTIAKENTP